MVSIQDVCSIILVIIGVIIVLILSSFSWLVSDMLNDINRSIDNFDQNMIRNNYQLPEMLGPILSYYHGQETTRINQLKELGSKYGWTPPVKNLSSSENISPAPISVSPAPISVSPSPISVSPAYYSPAGFV